MLPPHENARRAMGAAANLHLDRDLEHLRGLRDGLSGAVLTMIDPAWERARLAWNRAVERRPPLVAFPETVEDIRRLMAHARARGLRVAPQATGHGAGAGALGSIEDSLLLDQSRLREVSIDPHRRVARVGPGVTWAEVQSAARVHGLAGLAGYSPGVGVAGYTLGGGLGWFARLHGLACNSVLALEVVTADGRILRVDRDHEPDLFWALRGGGGSFAIVTTFELALVPLPGAYAGALFWPQERAAEVLPAWQAWHASLPDTVTSVGRLLAMPALPEVPAEVRGRSFVLVEAVCLTPEPEGVELMRPLRALHPARDTFAMVSPTALGDLHMDPIDPVPVFLDGWLTQALPASGLEALLSTAGPASGTSLLSVELRHLGGALAVAAPDHGALASLEGEYAVIAFGLVPDPATRARVEDDAAAVRAALQPWRTRYGYPNFAERSFDLADLFPPAICERLRDVKARYDPGDLIRSTHPVPVG